MNYPQGIKSNNRTLTVKNIDYKNRGMKLEDDLNNTNNYYIDKGIAYIYKKPTPIKLVKVDYKVAKITEAYFDSPSTTDYNGIYKGYYIDFEAKETNNSKGFPLINIHSHQIKHIRNIDKEKGICFLIVRFNKLNETYLLMSKDFINFIDNNDKKVIPITYFREKGYLIKDKFIPRVDYLEIIKKLLEV
ncbi:MAG: recombination protein U [Bacilli bacterium]|nr:recombination protein U [Bacilli bacterium]